MTPAPRDVGVHLVYFVLIDGDLILSQEIKIRVAFDKQNPKAKKFIEVAAEIKKIGKTGLVEIEFN